MCHMSLASAKPLHANPQYGHKMEGRRCENMGNSAVFGLTEGFFKYSIICSHHRDRIQHDVSAQRVHPRGGGL